MNSKIILSQSTFRTKVIKLYGSNCIVCGHNIVEAAHIVDKTLFDNGEYSKFCEYNGIPLCPNHHTIFDKNKLFFNINYFNESYFSNFINVNVYENNNFIGTSKIHSNAIIYFIWRYYKYNHQDSYMNNILDSIKNISRIDNGYYYEKDGDAIMI